MSLSSQLLSILVCPLTKDKLIYNHEKEELVSAKAGIAYPIVDDIPIMLVDQARKLNTQELKEILEKEEKRLHHKEDADKTKSA